MHGGMTRGMKAHVSTMLTEKRFEYFTAHARLQGFRARESTMQADKHVYCGAFRLNAYALTAIGTPEAMRAWAGRVVFTV